MLSRYIKKRGGSGGTGLDFRARVHRANPRGTDLWAISPARRKIRSDKGRECFSDAQKRADRDRGNAIDIASPEITSGCIDASWPLVISSSRFLPARIRAGDPPLPRLPAKIQSPHPSAVKKGPWPRNTIAQLLCVKRNKDRRPRGMLFSSRRFSLSPSLSLFSFPRRGEFIIIEASRQ